MNTTLEPMDHSPDTFQLSPDMEAGMDETLLYDEEIRRDMVSFIGTVKTIVKADLRALDFSDSAVSELADIYVGEVT